MEQIAADSMSPSQNAPRWVFYLLLIEEKVTEGDFGVCSSFRVKTIELLVVIFSQFILFLCF